MLRPRYYLKTFSFNTDINIFHILIINGTKYQYCIFHASSFFSFYDNFSMLRLLRNQIPLKLIKFRKMREKSWMMDLSATSVIAISFLLISSFFLLSFRAFLDRYLYHSTNNVDTKRLSLSLSLSLWYRNGKYEWEITKQNLLHTKKHSLSHK